MPALNETDYAKFAQMLDELQPEVARMNGSPFNFLTDMIGKNEQYGERVFVSAKQFDWIKKLHEEYIGDTVHEKSAKQLRAEERDDRDRDMDDDIPF